MAEEKLMTTHQDNNERANGLREKGTGLWRILILISVVAIIFVTARFLDLGDRIGDLRGWIESFGKWGILVFAALYIAGVVAALPGSAITATAGVIFGSVTGVILVSISSTAGAALSFLIARFFARDAVSKKLSKREAFHRLDTLIEKHGAVIVALTRLVPIFPFNILNYGFGLTKVNFRDYVFWSWLCMLPGTILYIVGADALSQGLMKGDIPPGLIGAVLGILIILVFLARFAKKKLRVEETN